MDTRTSQATRLVYARVAGFAYVLIIVLGVLHGIFIDSKLIVAGNHAATANNIMASALLFRLGIAGMLILYATVVVLSVALYVLLESVDRNLALLAMLLRFGEAILGAATVLASFAVATLLNGSDDSTGLGADRPEALVGFLLDVHAAGFDVVLLFVGLGGTVFCYLFLKSKYVPGLLASWGLLTYVSMIALALVSILWPKHPPMFEIVPFTLGGLFEVVFGFWLLFRGVNLEQWEDRPPASRVQSTSPG